MVTNPILYRRRRRRLNSFCNTGRYPLTGDRPPDVPPPWAARTHSILPSHMHHYTTPYMLALVVLVLLHSITPLSPHQTIPPLHTSHRQPSGADLSNITTFLPSTALLIRNIFTTSFLPHTTQFGVTHVTLQPFNENCPPKSSRLSPSSLGGNTTSNHHQRHHYSFPRNIPIHHPTRSSLYSPTQVRIIQNTCNMGYGQTHQLTPTTQCFNRRYCPYTSTTISLYYHRRHVK